MESRGWCFSLWWCVGRSVGFPLLVHSAHDSTGHDGARLKRGAQKAIHVSHILGPCSCFSRRGNKEPYWKWSSLGLNQCLQRMLVPEQLLNSLCSRAGPIGVVMGHLCVFFLFIPSIIMFFWYPSFSCLEVVAVEFGVAFLMWTRNSCVQLPPFHGERLWPLSAAPSCSQLLPAAPSCPQLQLHCVLWACSASSTHGCRVCWGKQLQLLVTD